MKSRLLSIFRTNNIQNADLTKYSLENLNDLNKYQNYFFSDKKTIDRKIIEKSGNDTLFEEHNKNNNFFTKKTDIELLKKNIIDEENRKQIAELSNKLDKYSKEDISIDYLYNEILQIIEFRDNLEKVNKEVALIIVLSYFYRRIFKKQIIFPTSFPINSNLALHNLFTNTIPIKIEESISNYFRSKTNLPEYPKLIYSRFQKPDTNEVKECNRFPNCVEISILHFLSFHCYIPFYYENSS